jgi:hypothetical protein
LEVDAMELHKRADASARTRGSSGAARAVRRGAALTLAALLPTAAAALAAAQFRPGATYAGQDSYCSSHVPGTTCLFKFRASGDGLSLRFVGKTVIDAWRCRGGGGEALLGGEAKGATPIPLVKVQAMGKLYGSSSYILRPTQGPANHYKVTVTGHLTKSGRTAVITFHNTYISSSENQRCATQPVTLTVR